MCWECGEIIDPEQLEDGDFKAGLINEISKQKYARSFGLFSEYAVDTVLTYAGKTDVEETTRVLNERAREGWKLHTMFSNELGKNALMVLGIGLNETVSESVMVFERRIEDSEIRDK